MNSREWPVGDSDWVARYRLSMAGKSVPAVSLEQRERELFNSVCEMKMPAEELFGDAEELAKEDADDLATVDETVRISLGGGLRPALREAGGMLLGIGIVAALLLIIRSGWSVDIDTASTSVAASVVVVFVGWVVGRALFSSGRSASALGALVVTGALFVAGIVYAVNLGSGHITASDVPVLFLVLVMLTPGIAALVVARRMPQQELRENWDDSEWLRRFRGGLRARLVPAVTARGHVAEVQQALAAVTTSSAYSEFGHPLSLAYEVAAADRVARIRLWVVSTIAAVGAPLCIAALLVANQSWGALTVPAAVTFALVAVGASIAGLRGRPWRKGQ